MNLSLKKLLFISVSAILYFASLILPAFNFSDRSPDAMQGHQWLTGGFFTFNFIAESYNPFLFISWLSNIPFIIGCIIFGLSRSGRGFKLASMVLFVSMIMSLGSLLYFTYNEDLYTPNIGCFVWLFSILLLWSGAHLLKREYAEPISD